MFRWSTHDFYREEISWSTPKKKTSRNVVDVNNVTCAFSYFSLEEKKLLYERTEQTICKGILSRLFFLLLAGVQKEKQVKEHSSAIYNFQFFS
jgi:hypothetical protein